MQIDSLFDAGFRAHQAGNFAEAGDFYRQVVAQDPAHCDALHLLGVLALQHGETESAERLIRAAIGIKASAEYLGNLGLALASAGRRDEAIAAYRQALSLREHFAEAHNNLANLLRQTGEEAEAIASYRRAIAARPDFVPAHANLGLALVGAGAFDEAADAFRQVISLQPANPDAWLHLGIAMRNLGRREEAIAAFQAALRLSPRLPEANNNLGVIRFGEGDARSAVALYRAALAARCDYPDAHYNLAIALHALGETADAIAACRQAVSLRPTWPAALNNLGIWLGETGRSTEALALFDAAIAAAPGEAPAYCNRGNVLRQMNRLDEAIESYRRAIQLRPDNAEAWNNLATIHKQQGRMDEAIGAFGAALRLEPGLAEAHNNLGNAHKDQGELDEALACYDRALALRPDDAAADSNRIYTLYFHPAFSAGAILAEHQRWNRRHTLRISMSTARRENAAHRRGKLRVGYVAPDFRDHCQSLFTLPLLSHHDRERFEIYCYSDVLAPDAVTAQLRARADVWRPIVGMSDARAAELICRDEIDILVDLTVHMAHNRLLAFARRPAPVQVTWLGYPGTTGMPAMDYRLSDPYLDPPGNDAFYSETTLRLPDSFWCYDPLSREPGVSDLPAAKNGFITFGCFNNFCKINDATLRVWAGVLRSLPDSRLLLLAPEGAARARVLKALGAEGIESSRIEFCGRVARRRYLELYRRIDIGLDTFPYNGHTTTLDALWMGVPVVSRWGETAVSRGGLSQLSNLGLGGLAAGSDAGFVQAAVALASDVAGLRSLRSALRDRLQASPLMDAPRFARNIENAYRQMWENRGVSRCSA